MNLSAPYPFNQPPNAKVVRELAAAQQSGNLAFTSSLAATVYYLRSQIRTARSWLMRETKTANELRGVWSCETKISYRTLLLKDIARCSSQLAECEAALDLVLGSAGPACAEVRCPRCRHTVKVGAAGARYIVLAHDRGSMRCSGTGTYLAPTGNSETRWSVASGFEVELEARIP